MAVAYESLEVAFGKPAILSSAAERGPFLVVMIIHLIVIEEGLHPTPTA